MKRPVYKTTTSDSTDIWRSVLTKKCAGIDGCRHIFGPNLSINSEWQFLSCATIAFSELYTY
jgi:hypothetical protein